MSQFAKAKTVIKNSTAKGRYKTSVLSPTASCQTKAPAKKQTLKKRTIQRANCGICYAWECADPSFPNAKGEKKKTRLE